MSAILAASTPIPLRKGAVDHRTGRLASSLLVLALGLAIPTDRPAAEPLRAQDPAGGNSSWTFEPNQHFAHLGFSVATAGDVNGDGYSDVIIGAPQFDNGQDLEGRAFVFTGSDTGLAASPFWTGESNSINARFGNAVAAAGDVNGDGYGDVIIGAFAYTNGQTSEGKAYVFLGSTIGLGNLPAWSVESNQLGAFFGKAVGTAGDVNGDGFADIIVGANAYDNGQTDEGRAFVYLGSAAGPATTPAWIAEGNQDLADFGAAVGTAGDVNADGFADVIVGAEDFDNGQLNEGQAYVYHGSAAGLSTTANWSGEADQASALFGRAVAGAGDVNGDGYADVIVGASGYSNGQAGEGAVFFYYGSPAGLSPTPSDTYDPNEPGAQFGSSVATAGDVDGNGFADVIIGAPFFDGIVPQEGVYGIGRGSPGGVEIPFVSGSSQSGCQFGGSVGTAGDVNGDGLSDVIVGAHLFDNVEGDEGRAFVFLGVSSGARTSPSWTEEGEVAGAAFGHSVANAGDVNGDGFSDLIVGAPGYANGELAEGRALVYHGSATGFGPSPAWAVESNRALEIFGWDVAGAGDVNGDGYADVIVGTANEDNTRPSRVYVYHGSPSGLATTAAWTVQNAQLMSGFGISVASAGDANGDGYSDVIIGAFGFDNGQDGEGRAYIYRGSAAGLGQNAVWITESNQENAQFGAAVGSAGDVNGDGYSDVIVGAPSFSNGEASEGRAYVYLGAPGAPATYPSWTGEGDQEGAGFGGAVGTSGDVNADGYSDILIGAPFYDTAVNAAGRVTFHPGSATGPTLGGQFVNGNRAFGNLGRSVSTAGDLNGDGFSDVLIGAARFGGPKFDTGAVAYYGSESGIRLFSPWDGGPVSPNIQYGIAVSTAGDANGDAYSDLVVGADLFTNGEQDEGKVYFYPGGGFYGGVARIPRQARTDDSAPIQVLGRSNAQNAFRLKTIGRTPAGRGRVRMQFEIKRADQPFTGTGLVTGSFVNTGAPGAGGSTVGLAANVPNLVSGTLHRWRLRVLTDSPFFPRSKWIWLADNAVTEADVRTVGAVGVDDPSSSPPVMAWFGEAAPNPFSSSMEVAYTVPSGGRLRLGVYDVQGRRLASLVDAIVPAGRHVARWDGRDGRGRTLPAGVYFLRLELGEHREARKIVIAR